MVLGPSSSRLMKASSVFVEQIEVRDENGKGAIIYGFSEKPELSKEANWSASNYLMVGSYGRKVTLNYIYMLSGELNFTNYVDFFFMRLGIEFQGYSLWLNKGSRISIRWATQTSRLDKIEVIIIKGGLSLFLSSVF